MLKQVEYMKNDLFLEPIITYMNTKIRKYLFSFFSFFIHNKVPLIFKRSIIQSYIISKALYFAQTFRFKQKQF